MASDPPFELDPRLADETHNVGELALCRVLLMDDARFPWIILVPRRAGLRELVDLDPASRATLWDEIDRASRAMIALHAPHKLNVAALGNVVPQLHVHVVARRMGDAAWPRPVWGAGERAAYEAGARGAEIARLGRALGLPS